MHNKPLDITIIGLTLSSSWGNGHATTFRSLIKGLNELGHNVVFLERNKPWYAQNRDFEHYDYCTLHFYNSVEELKEKYGNEVADADFTIVGSYTPDGVAVGEWVTETAQGITAFYDIDTPVTIEKLNKSDFEYLTPELIRTYNMYLSFTGGPILDMLEKDYHSPSALPLYCSVDTDLYYPEEKNTQWTLGYLGTYSDDRQSILQKLLIDTASRLKEEHFVVAGPQYPKDINWPSNVERIEHLPPAKHCHFYNRQKFTLNITRQAMIQSGFAPSVRLFEAAACATPIISDRWNGIETIFEPDKEILLADTTDDVFEYLNTTSEIERKEIGKRARERVVKEHSHKQRAEQLCNYIYERQKVESAW